MHNESVIIHKKPNWRVAGHDFTGQARGDDERAAIRWYLSEAKYGKNNKKRFPRWIRRYASAVSAYKGNLSVTEDDVKQSVG